MTGHPALGRLSREGWVMLVLILSVTVVAGSGWALRKMRRLAVDRFGMPIAPTELGAWIETAVLLVNVCAWLLSAISLIAVSQAGRFEMAFDWAFVQMALLFWYPQAALRFLRWAEISRPSEFRWMKLIRMRRYTSISVVITFVMALVAGLGLLWQVALAGIRLYWKIIG